jgi:S-adenosylhomocysteine hydrolase
MSDIKDKALAEEGAKRIEWAARDMPVLASVAAEFERTKPFNGMNFSACLKFKFIFYQDQNPNSRKWLVKARILRVF